MPRPYAAVAPDDAAPFCTYYQGFVGPGSLFDGEEGTRVADVARVANPTIMIVEAADPVPWTKPHDLPFVDGTPLPSLGGQFKDGFYAAFADGWPWFLSRQLPSETIRALIRRGDGGRNFRN